MAAYPPRQRSRREFLGATAVAVGASGLPLVGAQNASLRASPPSTRRRKRIALIASEIRHFSHAQHFADRFLEGFGWQGRHHYPEVDLVSLYVDQFPGKSDLARDRVRRHRLQLYPSVAEAITLGSERLAVDGVVIIGEHGSYPRNDKGQVRYPRHRWFKEIVRVFEDSGRSVPVFQDKHLSTDWDECVEQVEDSRRLNFPYLAGSSLPVTWRLPALEVPLDAALEESVCVCYGGVDSYDFHGYETAQCMSERRRGGEVGVRSVHALSGERLWDYVAARPELQELLLAALKRSHTLLAPSGYTFGVPTFDWVRESAPNGKGFIVEHNDGFRTTVFLLHGLLVDFNYAGRMEDGRVVSCQMYLPMPPRHTTLADFFCPLVRHIETMIVTGKAPYPVERTLLTSGMTLFGIESIYRGEVKLRTPELDVVYQPPEESRFWRT